MIDAVKKLFVAALAAGILLASGFAPAQEAPAKLRFSVMSYNVRFKSMDPIREKDGKLHPWKDRREGVLAVIREKDPDILGLQECIEVQQAYLAEELKGCALHKSTNTPIVWKKSTFTRVDAGNRALPALGPYGGGRRIDWVHLHEQGTKADVFVFNMHFSPGLKEPEQVRICRFVADFINTTAGTDTIAILTGDLNIHDDRSKGIQTIRDVAKLSDPWTDTGTSQMSLGGLWGKKPWSGTTIDWILYRRPLRATKVERPELKWQGEYPSDHLPVYAPTEHRGEGADPTPVTGQQGVTKQDIVGGACQGAVASPAP